MRETQGMRAWANFPPGGIAMGDNGTGDQLILLPKDNSMHELKPAVFWWDHETGEVRQVADDFADLL